MRARRRIERMLKQAEKIIYERRESERGGVYVCESDEELAELQKQPYAGPGEIGCLVVPPQLSLGEWLAKRPAAEPIQDTQ